MKPKKNLKHKLTAWALLLVQGINIFYPYQANAKSTDNFIPPIFKSVAAGHDVDLYSGDFSYSVPLIKIPSPTGDYPVMMNYKSGIRLNQESSWVGLGWSLNPGGSIYRTVAQYPDDYFNSPLLNKFSGSSTPFEPEDGSDNPGIQGLRGLYWASSGSQVNAYQSPKQRYVFNENFQSTNTSSNYKIQSTATKVDFAYGSLYQSHMPSKTITNTNVITGATVNFEVYEDQAWTAANFLTDLNTKLGTTTVTMNDLALASDAYHIPTGSKEKYEGGVAPVQMAYDNYIVTGDFSAKLQPFRYDNPSVSFPFSHSDKESALTEKAIEKYKVTTPQPTSKKVQFRVVGDPCTSFDLMGRTKLTTKDVDLIPYRMDFGASSNPLLNLPQRFVYKQEQRNGYIGKIAHLGPGDDCTIEQFGGPWTFNWNKYKILQQNADHFNYKGTAVDKFYPDYSTNPNAVIDGYNPNTAELAGANYVEWFSNEEFTNEIARSNGFISHSVDDFNRDIVSTHPSKGIGGYKITDVSGNTYHYSIPVYSKNHLSMLFTRDGTTTHDNNENKMSDKYAEFWLLTTVTGSDYIDKNNNGVADNGDEGNYIKYNYGQWEDSFRWRFPYSGSVFNKTNINKRSFESGENELYYLNSIETKTHTALFLKSPKNDGKSVLQAGGYKSCLRLDEIVLLKNEDWNTIKQSVTFTNNNLLTTDLSAVSSQIASAQIQRTVLNYDYSLCPSTPNSFESSPSTLTGKLTLKSISVFYKEDVKLAPDYVFEYNGTNPSFNYNSWDDWGYYKNITAEQTSGHEVLNDATADQGLAWSLSKIKDPTGGELNVVYERDDYHTVWQQREESEFDNSAYNIVTKTKEGKGDGLRVKKIEIMDPQANTKYITKYDYTKEANVSSGINGKDPGLDLSANKLNLYKFMRGIKSPEASIGYSKVTVMNEPDNSGIRNESGKVEYNFITSNTQLIGYYTHSQLKENEDRFTCNYSSFEPVFFDEWFWSQSTSFVDIATQLDNPTANLYKLGSYWNNKVYDIIYKTSKIGSLKNKKVYDAANNVLEESEYQYYDEQTDVTGAPKFSAKFQNVFGMPYGVITQACCLADRVIGSYGEMFDNTIPKDGSFDFNRNQSFMNRNINTYVTYYPNILYKIITKKKGLATTVEFSQFDKYTGIPTEVITENGNGEKYIAATTQAYRLPQYAELGSKVIDKTYKNILGPAALNQNYLAGNPNQLIASSAQTFKKNWTYREFSGGTNTFEDVAKTDVWRQHQSFVWKSLNNTNGTAQYNSATDNFNFSQNYTAYVNPERGWQKTVESQMYDHDSKLIESKDMNGNYVAAKYGYENTYSIASGGISKYKTFAYCGAESADNLGDYYSGEVLGSSKRFQSASFSHTGNFCSKLNSGQFGFVFKGKVGTDFVPGETYRVSVWIHKTNAAKGVLYSYLKNGSTLLNWFATDKSQVSTKQAGNYYLLSLDVKIPLGTAATDIEFGTWNPSSPNIAVDGAEVPVLTGRTFPSQNYPVYFDDFRVHNVNSPITANVFEPKTGVLQASLDKENFATKYYYDEAGRIVKVEVETLEGFKKTKEVQYNFGRP